MLQISIALDESFQVAIEDSEFECKGIIINSNILHSFWGNGQSQLFFLVDPTSIFAKSLKEIYLKEAQYFVFSDAVMEDIITRIKSDPPPFISKQNYFDFYKFLFKTLKLDDSSKKEADGIIGAVISKINTSFPQVPGIEALAKEIHLSQSRLSHLFKENTSMSLYSYILMQKLKRAIMMVFQGNSITEASVESGFDSPSHFASVCKKMLGMSTREWSKDSVFLKVSEYPPCYNEEESR